MGTTFPRVNSMYCSHSKLCPPFCWLDLATSMGTGYNWIRVISPVFTPPFLLAINKKLRFVSVVRHVRLAVVFAFCLFQFRSVVMTILFSGSVFTHVNTVERMRKMLSVRVSATVERSLSNCFARMVYTVYKKRHHILHFYSKGYKAPTIQKVRKSLMQSLWHRKVYQGVRAYWVCLQTAWGGYTIKGY